MDADTTRRNRIYEYGPDVEYPIREFWDWQHCRRDLPQHWEVIKSFHGRPAPLPAPADITERYIAALNPHDVNKVIALYDAASVHVTSERTIQGTNSLKACIPIYFKIGCLMLCSR